MTLPAMPPLTDPVRIERVARLLTPAQSVSSSSTGARAPACTDGTGRGAVGNVVKNGTGTSGTRRPAAPTSRKAG